MPSESAVDIPLTALPAEIQRPIIVALATHSERGPHAYTVLKRLAIRHYNSVYLLVDIRLDESLDDLLLCQTETFTTNHVFPLSAYIEGSSPFVNLITLRSLFGECRMLEDYCNTARRATLESLHWQMPYAGTHYFHPLKFPLADCHSGALYISIDFGPLQNGEPPTPRNIHDYLSLI